ncbi:hypothetical protein [Salinimicrobium oceani]|uniref:Uncharacterized protein n=1 Tax=Salinimicrobium oceani TaxID=2722702 RepID=A0ABX1CZY6_9FLAO|nr:hypothetical protein [Salinimicrobium oceani]NJW53824.1 hypothetical protein [Salinimicrobium oceani]
MKSNSIVTRFSPLFTFLNWGFGLAVIAAGFINTFWGNDPGFGIFLLLLSVFYFPPFLKMLRQKWNIKIHLILKILLSIFIIMAVLGVGELFYKIELMRSSF